MKVDNVLLAYITHKDQDPFIDLVELSKKGTSYLYEGERWRKGFPGSCTNNKGETLKISPLNKSYDRYEDIRDRIVIKDRAQDRYEKWMAGSLKADK